MPIDKSRWLLLFSQGKSSEVLARRMARITFLNVTHLPEIIPFQQLPIRVSDQHRAFFPSF